MDSRFAKSGPEQLWMAYKLGIRSPYPENMEIWNLRSFGLRNKSWKTCPPEKSYTGASLVTIFVVNDVPLLFINVNYIKYVVVQINNEKLLPVMCTIIENS